MLKIIQEQFVTYLHLFVLNFWAFMQLFEYVLRCFSPISILQGSEHGPPTFRMLNVHDGLYFVHFQPTMSILQSFSIAVAIIHTQSPTLRPKCTGVLSTKIQGWNLCSSCNSHTVYSSGQLKLYMYVYIGIQMFSVVFYGFLQFPGYIDIRQFSDSRLVCIGWDLVPWLLGQKRL